MHLDHVVLVDERHLEVELRELGLAVGAGVLVAEAARDLVVALEPRDHQQLLEQLRRLGQRVERAGLHAGGHEVVPRALGRRAGQVRRLDLEEVALVEDLAHRRDHPVAEREQRTASAPAAGRARGGAGAGSRRRSCPRRAGTAACRRRPAGSVVSTASSTSPVARFGLTFAGSRRATEPLADEHVLGAEAMRGGVGLWRRVGVEHELDDPGAVAQVDEDQPAVVAAAVDPAGDARLRAGPLGGQLAAPAVPVGVRARSALHASRLPLRIVGITFCNSVSCCSPDCMSLSVAEPSPSTIAT